MKFSIIIPVRSINVFLRENVEKLIELEYGNFEVIIVVDEPESFDFKGDFRFKIISSGKKGPGEKRNLGALQSTGDVLAFLDDDAYPKKDWLTEAEKILRDTEVYALGAPAVTPLNAGFMEKCSGMVFESSLTSAGTVYRHIPMPRRDVNDFPSVNLFVRKEAFVSAGGFTHEFWPGEDTKLCLDLKQKYGRPFLYDPKAIVYHHRRNLFLPHLKQISRYGRHRGQFARILPETSRLPGYFIPSAFLLGLFFGPLVSILVPFLWNFYFAGLVIYAVLVVMEMGKVFAKDKSIKAAVCVGLGIFLTHIVYGFNFIVGFIRKPKLDLRKIDLVTGNYIGG